MLPGALLLLVVAAMFWTGPFARAQSPCPYAEFLLETDQPVDREAICDAARPWGEDGFHVFILLTDHRPDSEDAWFDYLDQAEIDAGIRGADGFDVNALALEASTDSEQSWAYSVTYGERLYGSRLDENERAISQIKAQMREDIAAGDPTTAFVRALETSYETNNPPPSPWIAVAIVVLIVGALAVGGIVLALVVGLPLFRRIRRRRELERHRDVLQSRTSNLLIACDQLLGGDTPEETVLYQLYDAYGGERQRRMHKDVQEWLRRSQGALRDAFDLRQKLIGPSAKDEIDLEQQVHDWEMLYVTLVGNSERILALTDDELRTLLDPMLTLDREAPDAQLAEQLDSIRARLAGMPLKVEFRMVDPAETDAEGILGYVDRVKAQVALLQKARREAPGRLAEAQSKRQAIEEDVPSPFVMTEKQLLDKIDDRLERAEQDLKDGQFLRVVKRCDTTMQDLDTVVMYLATMGEHSQRRSVIEAITAQGYRPALLADDLKEVDLDTVTIRGKFAAGAYSDATSWIEELDADSQRALAGAQAWRALQSENIAALRRLRDETARVEAYRSDKVLSAWQALQAYPKGNWTAVASGMEQATQTLDRLRDKTIAQIERSNGLDEQRFSEAEQALAQASADLTQAEEQFQAVVRCLDEVKVAEAHIQEALCQTEADLVRAEMFRDEENAKVSPEVDQHIDRARTRLSRAQRLAESREFVGAADAQKEAQRLAIAANAAAREQVQEIDTLQIELNEVSRNVAGQVGQCTSSARSLPAVAQQAGTRKLVQQATDALSKAKQKHAACTELEDQKLAEALQAALTAYRRSGEQADRVRSPF
jgi:hypothetical protein